jgi:hypothetical protein
LMMRIAVMTVACTLTVGQAWAREVSPAADDPFSTGRLVRDFGRDLRDLPSIETAVILGVGGGLAAAVHGEAREITRRWSTSAALDRTFEPGAVIGSGLVQAGGALGVYVVGRVLHQEKTVGLGADLVRGQMMNGLLTQGITVAVQRQRPDGANYSFPSGHTSATFTTAAVLQRHFGWKAGVPAYAVAAFVGGSRVQENQHYLSDVVFGAALGIAAGRHATIGHGSSACALAPFGDRDRVGIALPRVSRE